MWLYSASICVTSHDLADFGLEKLHRKTTPSDSAFLCDYGLTFAQRQLSIHPAGVHFLNQACWIFSVLLPMEMFNHTWQNVGGMCHPGAPRTSLCRDCENSSSHFCCRAIMEHKELLRVPWDWQIGERGLQTQTHTNLDSYTQVILHWSAPTLKPPA